jgi:hypothetical protein
MTKFIAGALKNIFVVYRQLITIVNFSGKNRGGIHGIEQLEHQNK